MAPTMLAFPARLSPSDDGFLVSFRDIPEALTSGATREEALEMAADALASALDFYFEDRRSVPSPSPVRKGEVEIALPASMSVKVALLNEMIRLGVRPVDLARKLNVSPQTVNRIVDLRHATKLDTLAAAFGAIGRPLRFVLG
jgi:antitoxin HicB